MYSSPLTLERFRFRCDREWHTKESHPDTLGQNPVAVNERPPEAIVLYSRGFLSHHTKSCAVRLVFRKPRLLSLLRFSIRLSNTNRVRGATTNHPGRSDRTRSEELVQFSVVVSNDWYSPAQGGSRACLSAGIKDMIRPSPAFVV